uniref:Uncharacterized protein n=1 Tax=Cucumis sativus TaxID=3659 RepID=A0A0A0LFG5_CUCSA
MENSIYTILTIGRWESLNHMNYKFASLRPIHGVLALKFLKWVIKQPGLEPNHLTHILGVLQSCITYLLGQQTLTIQLLVGICIGRSKWIKVPNKAASDPSQQ